MYGQPKYDAEQKKLLNCFVTMSKYFYIWVLSWVELIHEVKRCAHLMLYNSSNQNLIKY